MFAYPPPPGQQRAPQPPPLQAQQPSLYPSYGAPAPGWGNGPQPAPQGPSSPVAPGSVSVLRLKIADDYKIDSPILVPATLMPSSNSTQPVQLDLALEKKLVEEVGTSDVESFVQTSKLAPAQDGPVKQFMDMGFSRAAASLGLAYCQYAKLAQTEAVDFANNYNVLSSMGYPAALAVGALLKSKNDVTTATETCLALSS